MTDASLTPVGRHWLGIIVTIGAAALIPGCTVHPAGERAERAAAAHAGGQLTLDPGARSPAPLAPDPTPSQLVDYALQANADLQQKYWLWRSAIEQIPQDGTENTNLVLSANLALSRGRTGLGQSTLSAGNDPMADIVLPPKLSVAARRALENARAAGLRFRAAQWQLRDRTLDAWSEFAYAGEMIRLEQANRQLLETAAAVVEARSQAGLAGQQDLLRARNELDLSTSELQTFEAQLPARRAAINALLDRDADAPLKVPARLPSPAAPARSNSQALLSAFERNPELLAQERESAADAEAVRLAKLQYLPDFSISASADLGGIAQSLLGMATVPILRHEAIDAAVAQAEANLRAADAMRRQTRDDLGARLVADLAFVRDADRQIKLLEGTILPRAQQAVVLSRSAYESGGATLLDLLDSQRSLISIRRLDADLRLNREKRADDIDLAAGAR